MNSAKKIALLLLHHLPTKCLFNILTFGACQLNSRATHIKHLTLFVPPHADSDSVFPTSVMKNKDTMNTASKFIQVCTELELSCIFNRHVSWLLHFRAVQLLWAVLMCGDHCTVYNCCQMGKSLWLELTSPLYLLVPSF